MWTVEQWRQIPDDLLRHQIIAGVHYTQHAPTTRHQRIVGNLLVALYRDARQFGDVYTYVGVELSPHDAVVPDLIFVSDDQRQIITERYVEGAPAIVIEIVEETTRAMDESMKRELYERCGVREYWLVDAERAAVGILRLAGRRFENTESGGTITSPLLPGFALDVRAVFAE